MSSQQQARLSLFGQPPLRCQVAAVDVSRLSLELSAGDSNTHLLVGDVAELRIEHPPLRITGQLTAINGRLLEFIPNPDQRQQLLQLLDHPGAEADQPVDTNRKRLLESLYSYAGQQYAGLLDYFFDEADVQLIRMAEWAANNQDQSQLFELKANLKTHEATIKQLALRYLRARIDDSSPEARDDPRDTRKRELELVDLERFEDWLSVEKVVRKWERELYQPLHFLEQRVTSLLDQQFSRRHQPLGIGNFCRALEDALRQVSLPSHSLPTVYSLFDRTVGPHFPELIDGLNNRLKQAGVLPDLEAQWHRQARQHSVPHRPAGAPPPVPTITDPGAGMPQPQTPAGADRLFSTALSLHHQGAANDTAETQRPDTNKVMAVLQSLQRRLAEGLADSGAPLLQRLESDGKALADSERHIIGLIDQVFTTLADNGHLTSAVKSTLRRLQTPLAQAALANPEHFNSPDHPARAMLNQLAVLYDSTELPNQLLEKRISAVVDTVLQDYSGDDHCFEQAHTELQQLLEQQQRAYRRNVERVTKTYAGRQQLKKAQRAVARELERRLPPTAIPQLIVDLIDNGWRELMTLTYIKSDEQHEGWREQLTVIEQLHHWLSDPRSLQDPTEALALVERIGRQLDSVFPGSYRHQPVLQRLRETLQGGADLASGIATTTPGWEPSGASNPGEVYSQLEATHPDMGRWLSRARNVEVGAEFGHLDRDQPEDRLRLAWKSDDLQHFVFVNRRGQKVLDYDLLDLAQDMAKGFSEVSTDSNWPLMERSLFATVQEIYQQLAYQGSHDDVTGLLNRKHALQRLGQLISDAKTRQRQHSLLYLEIDLFQTINSLRGQSAGDMVLKRVAELIKGAVPDGALAARMTGNEFCVTLSDTDTQQARAIAETLRTQVERERFIWKDSPFSATLSIGLLPLNKSTDNADNALRQAIDACKAAKQSGRNRIHDYQQDAELHHRRERLLGWLDKLNDFLASDKLVLRGQLIAPLAGPASAPHFEVLLGVRGQGDDILSPTDFIEAAECYNRMQHVDRWVIEHAFLWLDAIRQRGLDLPYLSINLSANSINDDSFFDFVLAQFGRYPIPTNHICFEVTETATIENIAAAADFIRAIKRIGCRFALDDFGTGRSSYEYLKHLPVDYLKIDGVFITEIDKNVNDRAMVRSINDIAHLMGKQTIAEFVESYAVRDLLKDIGVDFAQGYCIGKPMLLELYQPDPTTSADAPPALH